MDRRQQQSRSPYPAAALHQAAETFRQAWQLSASRAGSSAHAIHSKHLEHPPQLRVLHEIPNPHDAPMMMPLFCTGASHQQMMSQSSTSTGPNNLNQSHRSVPVSSNGSSSQSLLSNPSDGYGTSQSQSSCPSGPFGGNQTQSAPMIPYSASQSQPSLTAPYSARQSQPASYTASQSQPALVVPCNISQSSGSSGPLIGGASQSQPIPAILGKRPGASNDQAEASASCKRLREQAHSQAAAVSDKPAVLQCDICCLCCNTDSAMLQHLEASGHASASGCIRSGGNSCGSGSGGLVVVAPCRLRGSNAGSSDLEIMCPACHLPLGCRFACGLHYSLEHQSGNEMWAARPVLARFPVRVAPENVCRSGRCEHSQTGIAFANESLLYRHWRESPNCCPVSLLVAGGGRATAATSESRMLIIECVPCRRIFLSRLNGGGGGVFDSFGAFCMARSHAIGQHLMSGADGESSVSLSVTFVDLLSGRISRLPPVDCATNDGSRASTAAAAATTWSLQLARSLSQRLRQILSREAVVCIRLRKHVASLRRCGRVGQDDQQDSESDDNASANRTGPSF